MSTATKKDMQKPWSGWIVDVMYSAEASKIGIPELPLIRKRRGRSQASTTDLCKLICWRFFIPQIPRTL